MRWPFRKKIRLKFQQGIIRVEMRLKSYDHEARLVECSPVDGWKTWEATGDETLTVKSIRRHRRRAIDLIGLGSGDLSITIKGVSCMPERKWRIKTVRLGAYRPHVIFCRDATGN